MATRNTKVKFGDPPPSAQGNHLYDWSAIADQLRARPEQWALVFTDDKNSLVTAIRIDGIAALRKSKGFQVRTRNNKRPINEKTGKPLPRTCDLWMRYVPELDSEGSK